MRLVSAMHALLVGASMLPVLGGAARAVQSEAVLFRDVSVVHVEEGRIEPHQDVLVSHGRIARIAATGMEAPTGATIVDGKGRYLAPGLAEMHAHVPRPPQEQYAYDVLLLYVAHGITTIRGMLGDPWHLQLRERLQKHEVLGPRLYTAGPSLNGNSAPDPERARALVREQAKAGYDFLKLHPGLEREVFDAIAVAAREAGISVQGHVSEDVGLLHALEARQRAIDHLDGYVQALADPDCLRTSPRGRLFGFGVAHCADMTRIPDLVRRTKEAGTWMVPTAILLEQWMRPPSKQELLSRPAVRYLRPSTVERWPEQLDRFVGGATVDEEHARRYVDIVHALIRELHAQGVPILLGSDAPQVFNVPGDSALAELDLYTRAGLTPAQALRTATVNPARFFGDADRFGTVREGLEADLILLGADPLQDIRAVRNLHGVMVRGRWLSREEIDSRLEELAARVRGQGGV